MADEQLARGRSQTASGSRYLQQLCKHWSHKAAVEFDPTQGSVSFESGNRVELRAGDDALEILVAAPPDGDLDQWKVVVEKHLVRFAFREEFTIEWVD